MLDITWKVFSHTGNIETYLLLKELENVGVEVNKDQDNNEQEIFNESETLNKI